MILARNVELLVFEQSGDSRSQSGTKKSIDFLRVTRQFRSEASGAVFVHIKVCDCTNTQSCSQAMRVSGYLLS